MAITEIPKCASPSVLTDKNLTGLTENMNVSVRMTDIKSEILNIKNGDF